MLVAVRVHKDVVQLSAEHFHTVLELKRQLQEKHNLPTPFPFWVTYHGLVLLDDMMISEIGYLEGTELLCTETLTSSVVIPTAKGSEVWRVTLHPSSTSGAATGALLPPPVPPSYPAPVQRGGFLSSLRINGPTLDFNTLISCAGMMWSFWLLSETISREVGSFKENKTFADIAKSMVNGSIEGMLENISTIKKLLSTKLA